MKKISTFLSVCVSHGIYRLSFLMPRSRKIVVCIGWHTNKERELFADNTKYFFLHIARQVPTVRAIYLARDGTLAHILKECGYEAYDIHSVSGAWFALRARYTCIDAFMERLFWQYSGGSTIIQLWHGKGMKKTGHDSVYSLRSRNRFSQANMFTPLKTLIASSPYTAQLMASTFKEPLEKIVITGLPRNDILFAPIPDADIDAHNDFHEKIITARKRGTQKIILYAPTFRPDGSNPLSTLDLSALSARLCERQYHMIISLHPKFARKDFEPAEKAVPNIDYVDAALDIYPYLKDIDVLITDYSSLYVDFLLLDRPIIFYTYDIKTYAVSMGLHDDFHSLTPGPHPQSNEELLEAIVSADTYGEERKRVRQILFSYVDGQASSRLAQVLFPQ